MIKTFFMFIVAMIAVANPIAAIIAYVYHKDKKLNKGKR